MLDQWLNTKSCEGESWAWIVAYKNYLNKNVIEIQYKTLLLIDSYGTALEFSLG